MKITNKHNIDQSIYNVVSRVYPPRPNRFSITNLCNPPLIRVLTEKYWDELEEDAADKIWMVLGSSVHYVVEKGAPSLSIPEGKIEIDIDGNTIVGKTDLWENRTIKDFKVTSVYAFLLGDKREWEIQLNLCGWQFRKKGFDVDSLKISAILRDWQKRKAQYDKDYPQIPFVSREIDIWDDETCEGYIRAWLALYGDVKRYIDVGTTTEHTPFSNLEKQTILRCTPEQRWERPTTYAVMEKGKKRALRVLDTVPDAEDWKQKRIDASKDDKLAKKLYIEERKGEAIRCKDYCLVGDFCPFNPYREDSK